jgi:hypothetical protein
MLRTIGGVVAGFAAYRVFILLTFSISFLLMGADRAFAPGSYQVTLLWIVMSLVLSFVAAVVGGKVCATIAKGSGAVMGLASVVLIVGVASAVLGLSASNNTSDVRPADLSTMEAMANVREPIWVALLMPWIGLGGVTIGGRGKWDKA